MAYNFEPTEPTDVLLCVLSVRVIDVNKILMLVLRWSLTNRSTHGAVCISFPEMKWLRNFRTVLRVLYVSLDGLTENVCEDCRLRNFRTVLRVLYVSLDGLTENVCEDCRLLIWTVSKLDKLYESRFILLEETHGFHVMQGTTWSSCDELAHFHLQYGSISLSSVRRY